MIRPRRIFLAGTIQGANRGVDVEDQQYRTDLTTILTEAFPGVECFDPSAPVRDRMADPALAELVVRIASDAPPVLATADLPGRAAELRTIFREMAREAGRCDLCVAYLPHRIPSMGTAMEMYAAHLAGVPVVAVTEMVENLAVVSTADWIVRDLDQLRAWLDDRTDETSPR
ncbi:hypothetical protein GCM10027059_49520 [Myceligenerans halotolerans]